MIEIAHFQAKSDVTDAQVIAADQQVREGMLKTFPGFIARELYKSEEPGVWVVILRFTDKPQLNAFLDRLKAMPDVAFKAFGALIDRSTMRVELASAPATR